MIKVSHEVPICLLEESKTFNDYDYALVHLFDEYPEYYNFFKQSIKDGRKVILDNSVFELETAFDSNKFIEAVEKLNPTVYIIPDALENKDVTIHNVKVWNRDYRSRSKSLTMGVVQGKTYKEAIECYKFLCDSVDVIGISFDYSFYRFNCEPKENKWQEFAAGRQMFIDYMIDKHIIDRSIPHHLLGASVPYEFIHYKDDEYNFIDTLDTSNPIVAGIKGVNYTGVKGLTDKYTVKLATMINTELNDIQLGCIRHNVKEFKKFI